MINVRTEGTTLRWIEDPRHPGEFVQVRVRENSASNVPPAFRPADGRSFASTGKKNSQALKSASATTSRLDDWGW